MDPFHGDFDRCQSGPSTGVREDIAPLWTSSQRVLKRIDASQAVTQRANAIRQACESHDIDALIQQATSEGGLLDDDLRRIAWPILLHSGCEYANGLTKGWNDLPPHRDENQVQLDVNRSFVYYPRGTDEELSIRKMELSSLITQVLRRYPMLCYFQGYHDIAQVLLLVLGETQATSAFVQISLFRIRDYMLPSLSPALKHLQLIPAIIGKVDSRLWHRLSVITPFFALAATLTLYAHDIQEYSDIARLFDFLLAHEPVVSIYLFAAIILSRKKELTEIPEDEPEMLHITLTKLPNPLDLEGLILSTVRLFEDFPPETLKAPAWSQIPACSVLKTSRDICVEQTVADALSLFQQQTRQLCREELRQKALGIIWKHRRMVRSVALTITVGIVAYWMRKGGLDFSLWVYFERLKSTFYK